MLCQRASLCPAETQEDKHQQTTKRSPGGQSYLDASLPSQFMPWMASERPRPSLYPKHQRFMTQLLATRLKHKHRGSVCFCQIYSVIFWTESSPWSLLPYTLSMHMHRSWEINGELTRHLFSPSRGWTGPWGEESKEEEEKETNTRKRNCFAVNFTPFTPFKSPFSSESRVKITLWLRLWSCKRTQRRGKNAGSFNVAVVIRKHG